MTNCCENTRDAAAKGHINCIKDLRDAGHPWYPDTTRDDTLRVLHELGCPWHPDTTLAAVTNGNKDTLILLYELGCPWYPKTTLYAALNGHIDIVKYIYENCGDEISWEASGLEDYKNYGDLNEYFGDIEESWKSGMNRTGYGIKPAR